MPTSHPPFPTHQCAPARTRQVIFLVIASLLPDPSAAEDLAASNADPAAAAAALPNPGRFVGGGQSKKPFGRAHTRRCVYNTLQHRTPPTGRLLGWASYLAIESYGSLTVAMFWAFTNSSVHLEGAKSVYGLILAGAQVGRQTDRQTGQAGGQARTLKGGKERP